MLKNAPERKKEKRHTAVAVVHLAEVEQVDKPLLPKLNKPKQGSERPRLF